MKKINLEHYPRLGMYQAFKDRAMPCFSTTCQLEVTPLLAYCRQHELSFFICISYLISCAVNHIPQFKHRIVNGELVEFETIDPGFTVLQPDDTFSFCDAKFFAEFADYYAHAASLIKQARTQADCSTHEKHQMFFITSIPWFSFTSFVHPYDELYACIPLITLGKYFNQGEQINMPVAIQVHHGLVDGVHVGKFYQQLAQYLQQPEVMMAPGE